MVTLSASAKALANALVELGGEATPGEAAAAAGVPTRTASDAFKALREAGLVEGPKSRVRLTSSGWSRYVSADPVSAGDVLDQALDLWGHLGLYAHRAYLELLWSAMVARARLADSRPDRHLGFMAVGGTGTGKSALADMTCSVFGLPRARHTLNLPSQTVGAVLGRREPAPGGGQRWVPSPVAALPFVLFDEFDKADEPVRRAVLPYFQGDVEVQAEGEVHRLLPTPMLASNVPTQADRLKQLRAEYRRRSVVLDTGYAGGHGDAIERALTDYYAGPRPHLDLAALPQPQRTLPALAGKVLDQLGEVLTDTGRQHRPPRQALEAAALGRASLAGDTSDHGALWAAYSIGAAYLQVTEQLDGEVVTGWVLDFAGLRAFLSGHGAVDKLEEVVTASRGARAKAQVRGAQVRVAAEVEDLGVVRERHTLAEQLRLAREDLDGRKVPDRADKATAAGLRAQLGKQRTAVLDCRSRRRLEDLRIIVTGPLEQAVAMRQRLDVEQHRRRTAEQQAKADAAIQERQTRDIARQHTALTRSQRRAQQAQAKAQLADVRSRARTAEGWWSRTTTPKNAPPWRDLERHGLLRYEPPAPEPEQERRGVLARFSRGLTSGGGTWVATGDPGVHFPGTRAGCRGLESWGPGTQAVLLPWLLQLHADEDQLVAEFGLRDRSSRPALYAPARALPPGRAW